MFPSIKPKAKIICKHIIHLELASGFYYLVFTSLSNPHNTKDMTGEGTGEVVKEITYPKPESFSLLDTK